MDEQKLIARLRAIEALAAGASIDGERDAAARAAERVRERLAELRASDPVIEHRFAIPDPWSQKLFVALARRYGLEPYRRPRQKLQTVMLDVPRTFVDDILWPRFTEANALLRRHLADVSDRVIAEALGERSDVPLLG